MRQIVIPKYGDVSVFRIEEKPDPPSDANPKSLVRCARGRRLQFLGIDHPTALDHSPDGLRVLDIV